MARLARVVVAGFPHHITQRGNRHQKTFWGDEDYRCYIELMAEWCRKCGVEIWAYVLMPNEEAFVKEVERQTGRVLRRMKPGPKPRKQPRRR